MNDCIWALISCDNTDNCPKCDRYLSVNSRMGRAIDEEYSTEVELAVRPITKKYRHIMNGDWKLLSRDEGEGSNG